MRTGLLYAILAFAATVANVAAQEAALRIYGGPMAVAGSVLAGTAVGLATKYVLDKRFIFGFRARDAAHDARTFVLYTLTGVFTTAVFWSFEFGFDRLFASKEMRYAGGALGLAIGYALKYHLDRRHVFRAHAA